MIHAAMGSALKRMIARTVKDGISKATGRLEYLDPDIEEAHEMSFQTLGNKEPFTVDLAPAKREVSLFESRELDAAQRAKILNALERVRRDYSERGPGRNFRRIDSPWIVTGSGADWWPVELADEVETLLRRL